MADRERIATGWREWAAMPELGIERIKIKLDTGARTSALHAFDIEEFEQDGRRMVRFSVNPGQGSDQTQQCVAEVIDKRQVTDSGGHREERLVIRSEFRLGAESWPIEITLTSRANMRFRMLLGRTAMRGRLLVQPDASFLVSLNDTIDIEEENLEEDS